MKMKLALVLLLFLGVGALARSSAQSSEEEQEAVDELGGRYARSASGESSEVAAGEPPGKSGEGDLKTVPNETGANGSGMSGESKSENSSKAEKKAKLAKSGEEDQSRQHKSSEENVAGSKESSRSGGKSEESSADGGQSNGGGTGDQYGMYAMLKHLARILGLNGVGDIPVLISKYYSGNLPVSIEGVLRTVGITTSIQEMKSNSGLYQLMKSVPIVGTIVRYMTNTLLIPINVIAVVFSLGCTIIEHMYNSLPSIL